MSTIAILYIGAREDYGGYTTEIPFMIFDSFEQGWAFLQSIGICQKIKIPKTRKFNVDIRIPVDQIPHSREVFELLVDEEDMDGEDMAISVTYLKEIEI